MEKIDLRELNRMTRNFRASHRALKRLKDGEEFQLTFQPYYHNRRGTPIPIIDYPAMDRFVVAALEGELSKLRKRFAEMGVDPLDIDGRRRKAPLKVAK